MTVVNIIYNIFQKNHMLLTIIQVDTYLITLSISICFSC